MRETAAAARRGLTPLRPGGSVLDVSSMRPRGFGTPRRGPPLIPASPAHRLWHHLFRAIFEATDNLLVSGPGMIFCIIPEMTV